jgi:uncharacterized protein (TIGR03437 family)
MSVFRSPRPAVYLAALAFSVLAFFLIFATARTRASGSQPAPGAQSSRQEPAQREAQYLARLRELDEKLRDPRLLLLRTGEFDPLAGEPSPVRVGQAQLETTNLRARAARLAARAGQAAEKDQAYFIVQYRDRIQPQWTESLRAAGYEIAGYLANNAYILKAPRAHQGRLQAAQSRGEYRWVGAYGAGLKVEGELARLADGIAAGSVTEAELQAAQMVAVAFISFRGADSAALREVIGQLSLAAEPIIEDRYDGRAWGLLRVTAAELPRVVTALAGIEGIEWIARRRAHRLLNDNGVKVVQSGVVGTDAPLYRNGLTGAGQIFGVADSGLDADHAQFRLDGQASSQTLSFAVTTQALVNGLLPVNVTNPNNKLLAYYLLGSGNLIDNAANPNGGKTLDPDQKIGSGSNASYFNSVAYDDSDGGYHGTHTTSVAVGRDFNADGSGALPGILTRTSGDGVAPDARLVFQDIGHPSGQLPGVDSVSQALIHQQAYSSGVRVHSNSYGPPPPLPYDQDAADIDDAMWRLRDYTIFFAAGNDSAGVGQVTSVAKNNIVVAATDTPTNGGNIENLASYSNHGPTQDGRIKPDIAAPGAVRAATESTGILTSQFGNSVRTSTTALDAAVNPANPNINRSLSGVEGTSFSTPMAAGGALLVRQYFTDGYYPSGARNAPDGFNPSNALVKALMLNSGRNMTGRFTASDGANGASGPLPNFGQGWGRLALDDALYFTGDRRELKVLADIFNGAMTTSSAQPAPNPAIMTGQTHTYQLTNVSTVEPLRITLVWSDPKASVNATIALVNNLDLEVVDPQGAVYRGNVNFANAYSQPAGSAAFDNRNPVEAVYIQFPQPGTYTVRVIGANVPGNGQMQMLAQPGAQLIDSNRQGYALIATGNFTAGAQAVLGLNTTAVSGGVNADQFISRNETVTAAVTVTDQTVVPASNVNVQVAVDAASQVPANLIRINGQAAGQSAALNYGDIGAGASQTRAFQITLLDDGTNRAGQKINFNVTMTPANGPATVTQFALTASQRIIAYRTRFEPTPDPGGDGVIVIPESAWGLRPDNPNPPPVGSAFAGSWQLTTAQRSNNDGSTASLGDPSGIGASYGTSNTARSGGGIFDDTRWWTTQKILLPGLTVNQSTNRVSNPELAAQLRAAIDSFEVDVNADFTGDVSQSNLQGDLAFVRVRTYRNTASVNATDDSGFNDLTFTNLLLVDSTTSLTSGFRHFSGSSFANGDGVFGVDAVTPDNSDVAFRLELQLRRNSVAQTGEGVFFDNLVVRFRVGDLNVYTAPASNASVSVNAASFTAATTPGQILSAFGGGFPASTNLTAQAQSLPLPTQLGKVSVRVNGIPAPLFFVGVGGGFGAGAFQINYQLPYETLPGMAFVEVLNNGMLISSEFLSVGAAAPGVFTLSANGIGQAAAVNQDFSLNGDPHLHLNARPEARGRVILIFATGQGGQFINPATQEALTLATGVPAPANGNPLFATASAPAVTIGGVPAAVAFSGLSPGFVGLWQLNVVIPENAPTGNAVPLVVSLNGQTSLATTIAVN